MLIFSVIFDMRLLFVMGFPFRIGRFPFVKRQVYLLNIKNNKSKRYINYSIERHDGTQWEQKLVRNCANLIVQNVTKENEAKSNLVFNFCICYIFHRYGEGRRTSCNIDLARLRHYHVNENTL